MLDQDVCLPTLNRYERSVLRAYADLEGRLPRSPAPDTGQDDLDDGRWVFRIRDLEGVPGDRLAPAHGRLIAHGLLHFQLLAPDAKVVYRLTPAGRSMAETLRGGAQGAPASEPHRYSA